MKRIVLPDDGVEAIFGPRDANLKHIEGLLGVRLRTQGHEVTAEGPREAEALAERIFLGLAALSGEGYQLSNGDVKTAAQLIVDNHELDLRDYFLRGNQRQAGRRRVAPKTVNQRRYLEAIEQLEQALETFDGTILLVTHDRRMLDTVRLTRRWHVDAGVVTEIAADQ